MKGANYVPVLVFFAGILLLLFALTAQGRAVWDILTGKVDAAAVKPSGGAGRSW